MRLRSIREADATGFTAWHRVGFAPQPCVRRLRISDVLDRIRPSFFSNSFFSSRLATTDLPGDNSIQ